MAGKAHGIGPTKFKNNNLAANDEAGEDLAWIFPSSLPNGLASKRREGPSTGRINPRLTP
jgi:hypothetical protein